METFISEIVKAANDVAKVVLGSGPEALTVVVAITVGYMVKATPLNNKWIPLVIFIVAPAFYWAISNPGDQPPDLRYPAIRQIGIGAVMAATAWMVYETVVRKYVEPLVRGKPQPPDSQP